jgi:cation:H+ antiporter
MLAIARAKQLREKKNVTYILLCVGLALLAVGGDFLVKGAVGLAKRMGISPLMIGLTVVAWGTSTPELLVSIEAALRGSPGIAVGNVVGSNIFNIIFILGLTAMIRPIMCSPRAIYRDGSVALFAAAAFIAIALGFGVIHTWHGVIMLLLLAFVTWYAFRQEKKEHNESAILHEKEGASVMPPEKLWLTIVMLVGGLAALIVGSNLLVTNAIQIARGWGVSETVIGLTLVAGGTSLPELAASLAAAFRRQADVALGNIIGSNIYNILAILGVASLFGPIPIPTEIINFDMWLMLAVTLLLFPPLLFGGKIGRVYGGVFFACYFTYVYYLFALAPAAAAMAVGG